MAANIRLLEQRVHDVVERLRELTAERDRLRDELRMLHERVPELGGDEGARRQLRDGERARIVAEIRGSLEELAGAFERASSRGPTP